MGRGRFSGSPGMGAFFSSPGGGARGYVRVEEPEPDLVFTCIDSGHTRYVVRYSIETGSIVWSVSFVTGAVYYSGSSNAYPTSAIACTKDSIYVGGDILTHQRNTNAVCLHMLDAATGSVVEERGISGLYTENEGATYFDGILDLAVNEYGQLWANVTAGVLIGRQRLRSVVYLFDADTLAFQESIPSIGFGHGGGWILISTHWPNLTTTIGGDPVLGGVRGTTLINRQTLAPSHATSPIGTRFTGPLENSAAGIIARYDTADSPSWYTNRWTLVNGADYLLPDISRPVNLACTYGDELACYVSASGVQLVNVFGGVAHRPWSEIPGGAYGATYSHVVASRRWVYLIAMRYFETPNVKIMRLDKTTLEPQWDAPQTPDLVSISPMFTSFNTQLRMINSSMGLHDVVVYPEY